MEALTSWCTHNHCTLLENFWTCTTWNSTQIYQLGIECFVIPYLFAGLFNYNIHIETKIEIIIQLAPSPSVTNKIYLWFIVFYSKYPKKDIQRNKRSNFIMKSARSVNDLFISRINSFYGSTEIESKEQRISWWHWL